MGLPTILKTASTAQEEEHRQERMGEPCPGAHVPSQTRSGSTQQAGDTTGNAPGQGCSLGTAHIWTVPTPFPRVLNSH